MARLAADRIEPEPEDREIGFNAGVRVSPVRMPYAIRSNGISS
jgi:hypothetical protein